MGGAPCCVNPAYTCQVDPDTGGVEDAGFMRCVRAMKSPPPVPPTSPPPPQSPPPRPFGPPPDPPFAPLVLGDFSHRSSPQPSLGGILLAITVLSLILIGIAHQAGLIQACTQALNWDKGMQRVSLGDDARDRRRSRKGKRRSKKYRGGQQEELDPEVGDCARDDETDPAALVKPVRPKPLVTDDVPDLFPEPFNPSAACKTASPAVTTDCLLILECEHTVGLLASAKRVLEDNNSCVLSSVAATTLVRDGDVWTRMTGTVSIGALGSEADAIRVHAVEELRATLAEVKYSLTLERKPDLKVQVNTVKITKA